MKRECEICIKRKTMYCPNSTECYDTSDMPYYQNRIMLLEENKQLKEKINKAIRILEIQIEVIKEQPSDNSANDNMEIKLREMVIRLLKEVSE